MKFTGCVAQPGGRVAVQIVRWMVRTEDRLRMTLDVVQVISDAGINILAMEVSAHHIFVKFRADPALVPGLRQQVLQVPGVRAVEPAPELITALTRATGVSFADILHVSPAMSRLIAMARQAARSDATVLLIGESGTGKDLLARAIHGASPRSGGRFVPVNCAALPESLMESELFGYEPGAFTGARPGGRQGIFEYADQGTVLLDEIGELPLHLQAKLLRVLQDGRVRRVGGREEVPVDVRVIAATNRDLAGLVRRRQFRDDLYYRLSVIPLVIPPLRERPEDLDLLVDHFLDQWSQRTGELRPELTPEAREALRAYPWPGNVRELENVIERALTLAEGGRIGPEQLLLEQSPVLISEPGSLPPEPGSPGAAAPGGGTGTEGLIRTGAGAATAGLKEQVAAREREVLRAALARHGSVRKAARALGVSHTTVLNKLRRYGIQPPR